MNSVYSDQAQALAIGIDFRRPFLVGLMVFILLFLVWHTIAESRLGFGIMTLLEGALALYSATLLYVVLQRPYSPNLALAFVLPAMAVIVAAMFHPGTPINVYIWTFLFPILTYSLLGRRLGLVLTLAGSLLSLAAYLSKAGTVYEGGNLLIIMDVVICMCIIWSTAHLYERYRETSIAAFRTLATTDALTGLHNRRQMESAFVHLSMTADRQQRSLAVITIDLDHFKQINDQKGHDAGDAVLQHTATLLRDNIRKSDWAFRTGGEEFCLLMEVDERSGAIKAAESVLHTIEATPCIYGDDHIALTASIGIAIYPDDDVDFDKLLQLSDSNMYQAKQAGRNRVVATAL